MEHFHIKKDFFLPESIPVSSLKTSSFTFILTSVKALIQVMTITPALHANSLEIRLC